MNLVLFDGVCNLCNSTVQFLIAHDTNNKLHFAAQQTDAGIAIMKQYNLSEDVKSVIFLKEGVIFYKSDAIIEIAALLTGWPKLLKYGKLFPKCIRNGLYELVAKHRYRLFGKKEACALPNKAYLEKFIQ